MNSLSSWTDHRWRKKAMHGVFLGLLITLTSAEVIGVPLIRTDGGILAGKSVGAADEFLGVPYAAPPIGTLRWMPPQPAKPWTGIRDATHAKSRCVQNDVVAPLTKFRNEDCLYLNIYRPAHPASAALPVLFWLHGGAFIVGAAQDIDGSALAARQNMVVVSISYRLGAFGFANMRQLQVQQPEEPMGNYAIRDQLTALRWVRANIAAFGGDPKQVTIIGQSAGGASVLILMASPESTGLFKGAIEMSGGIYSGLRTAAQEEKYGPSSKMVSGLLCGTAKDIGSCMRAKSADDVYVAGGGFATRVSNWTPTVDGKIIPDQPLRSIGNGKFLKVPLIAGIVASNAEFFVQWRLLNGDLPWTEKDYSDFVAKLPNAGEIAKTYPYIHYKSGDDAYIAVASDQEACSALDIADAASPYTPVFFYEFDDPMAPSTYFDFPSYPTGSFHTADIPYVFQRGYPNEHKPLQPEWSPAQKALSDRLMQYVGDFARNGDPHHGWNPGEVWIESPNGDHSESVQTYRNRHHCDLFKSGA